MEGKAKGNIIEMVYETYDYSLFKKLPENRIVRSDRKEKLISSMTQKYVLSPICVNGNFEIIDGQGRYEARKEMGLPIHYIIDENAKAEDCRLMNQYNTPWSATDYMNSFCTAGNLNYILLRETVVETKMAIKRVLRLAGKSGDGPESTRRYRSGYLVFTQHDKDVVLNIKEKGDDILSALLYAQSTNNAFWAGLKICVEYEGYDHARMIEKCKKNRSNYVQMSKLADQLAEFERIYNSGCREKNKIYFSDYMRNKGSAVRDYSQTDRTYWEEKEEDVSTLVPIK